MSPEDVSVAPTPPAAAPALMVWEQRRFVDDRERVVLLRSPYFLTGHSGDVLPEQYFIEFGMGLKQPNGSMVVTPQKIRIEADSLVEAFEKFDAARDRHIAHFNLSVGVTSSKILVPG